jgi:hypothetical protein
LRGRMRKVNVTMFNNREPIPKMTRIAIINRNSDRVN